MADGWTTAGSVVAATVHLCGSNRAVISNTTPTNDTAMVCCCIFGSPPF